MSFASNFVAQNFADLSNDELYQIIQLRTEIFVLEQQCPYQDLDGLDQLALHLLQKADSGNIIAYARILIPAQCNYDHCSIGRVVVSQQYRKQKLGYELMQAAITKAQVTFPNSPIKISAQTYLTRFYQNLGFINTGYFYLEDDIPHQEMIYQGK